MNSIRRAAFVLAMIAAIATLARSSSGGVPQYETSTPQYGIRDKGPSLVAFTNANIVVSPTLTLDSAILVIRDGRVAAVGKSIPIPTDATVVDLAGKFITPAFIDPFTNYGIEKPPMGGGRFDRFGGPQYEGREVGVDSWNDAIHSEVDWVTKFKPDAEEAKKYMEAGYGVVQSCSQDGVFRGRAFVALLNDGLPNDQILVPVSQHFLAFDKGTSRQEYPSSEMGSIALVRQTLLDAEWYTEAQSAIAKNPAQVAPETNLSLAALANIKSERVLFQPEDELSLMRADKIAKEFGLNQIYLGNGYEYTIANQIKAAGIKLVLPMNFPKAPYVKTPEDAVNVSLADMRHWEVAPSNPSILAKNQIEFAFTSAKLKDREQLLKNIRKAIKRGLSKEAALSALTIIPAKYCGVADRVGTLESGKIANFIVSDTDLFDDDPAIYSVWIAGKENRINPVPKSDIRGNYELTFETNEWDLVITGTMSHPQGNVSIGKTKKSLDDFDTDGETISFALDLDTLNYKGILRFSGFRVDREISGDCALPDGRQVAWRARFESPFDETADTTKPDRGKFGRKGDADKEKEDTVLVSHLTYPNKAYGVTASPPSETVLVKNATVWTSEADGILKNVDVLISNGKFSAIGQNLSAPAGAKVIDGSDKHMTAGIIDEHSHIAISRGVNEGSHSITSEVRIGDVLNPEDISIYRTLAGGVTMSQLLHGSANPIGGQAQVIKHKWGASADELKFAPAPASIKFALGENVKQSNWGDRNVIRYPQTRMGVETIMKDAFVTAKEYEATWRRYNALSNSDKQKTIPPRRDLQLDALVEILNSRMFIHCHSYHQTEILMLMRLAEELGFRIQTFTHILEGYKVADEMREHGATANSFADWWAYKFEVYDAIAYNAALMAEKGVVTGINSDDSEMSRRLNQEAGKSVLYGNMSQEEAIKMVTINPAKQLKVDDRVGSIKVGKDADFVIWSTDPLSTYAKCEQTWIEGRNYFSLEKDSLSRVQIAEERNALTQKILKSGGGEREGGEGFKRPEPGWRCEDFIDVWRK